MTARSSWRHNETERLSAPYSHHFLDTSQQPAIDVLTRNVAAVETRSRRPLLGWYRHALRWLRHADPYHYTPQIVSDYKRMLLSALARYDLRDSAQQVTALQACIPILFTIREPATQVQFARDLAKCFPPYHERAAEFMMVIMAHIDAYGRGGVLALSISTLPDCVAPSV